MTDAAISGVKITIGITCYNAADTIGRAIQSALAQDWSDFEIIIVDDCSPDNSWAVIQDLAAQHSRIIPVRHEANQGAAAARNTLLQKASGNFITFFDDDDESFPKRLPRQYEALTAYEKLTGQTMIVCYASGSRRYPNGYELDMPAIGSQPVIPAGGVVADYLLFNGRQAGFFYGSGTPTCALMARVSTLQAVGGFDPTLRRVEDVDLAVRIALQGGHFIGVSEKLFLQHATKASDKTASKNLQAELALIDKHAGYLKQKGSYNYMRRWFTMRAYHFGGQRVKFIFAVLALLIHHPMRTACHLARSLPARWKHEKKMNQS